jgi:uncharacterized protein YbcI
VFPHVGFFFDFRQCDKVPSPGAAIPQPPETTAMDTPTLTMAQQIAKAASAFEEQRTGLAPSSVTVVLSDNTLVITLHGALSAAEKALSQTPKGAAQVQDFHRQLFASAAEPLRQEIRRITGVEVREAAAEVEPATGTVVQVFTSGTMVQVFLLANGISAGTWSGNGQGTQS